MRTTISLMLLVFAAAWASYDQHSERLMASNRAHHLAIRAQQLYGMPVEKKPKLLWNKDLAWEYGAWANCRNWTITINHYELKRNTDYMLQQTLPHEFAHLVHCYVYGHVGDPPHNQQWKFYVQELGGKP